MIRFLLNLYSLILVVDAILSYLPTVRAQVWAQKIKRTADFTLNPIRKILPPDLPFDVSPIVVILALRVVMALW